NACRARFYRGDILRVMKRYREAADELSMIEESYPGCPLRDQALLNAGECLISAGDPMGAAAVLRRLVDTATGSETVPRAMFSLAMALRNIGRDLEADNILQRLISEHPGSPVTALALLRMGERAMGGGQLDEAERYFRRAESGFKEPSLRQKASSGLIDVKGASGDDRAVLEKALDFLGEFPGSEMRPSIYRKAIDSAWKLGEADRALGLLDAWTSEGSVADSTGQLDLLKAGILASKGRRTEAIAILEEFRHRWSRSPLLVEALMQEASLLRAEGRSAKAASMIHLALLEQQEGPERAGMLESLADLSATGLGDTLSAIRYWEEAALTDLTGEVAAGALWKAGRARESLGDVEGALGLYRSLLERFPDSDQAARAAERIAKASIRRKKDDRAISEIAAFALAEYPAEVKSVEIGMILLEKADMPGEAAAYLNRALKDELPPALGAKARFYLGAAYHRMYELSSIEGEPDGKYREKALTEWLKGARDYAGTQWGGSAHRGYLEDKLEDWNTGDRLKRLDEFLAYYEGSPDGWWAIGEKGRILYEAASAGQEWAVDSALSVLQSAWSGGAGDDIKKESILRMGYLYRLKGMDGEAAGAFRRFLTADKGDSRAGAVYYDLGETLISMKDYPGALQAYDRCMESGPSRSMSARCTLRIGDVRYYMHDLEGAAREYGSFGARYPESRLVDEAAYREAMVLERMGDFARCDSILNGLESREDLPRPLRTRLLSRLAYRMKASGDPVRARELLRELVSLERRHEHLALYGEVLLDTGELKDAERMFSDAIRFEGVDTCRVLSGRAVARFRQGETARAQEDLQRLLASYAGCGSVPAVLLAKGVQEAEAGRCEQAEGTFAVLRERYPGTVEASTALYHLSICDMKRGGYEEASQKLTSLLREAPHIPILDKVYFKLASAHYGAGNLNLAASNYRLAAEAATDEESVFNALKNMAMIYQELEEYDKAADGWYRLCETFPGHKDIVEMFFNLGFCYAQSGSFEMAREVYERIPAIAESEEQQGRAHYWSGISLKNLGRYDEAVREFLRVPYLRTGGMWGVTSKLEAAGCYERLGQKEQALQIYERILANHGERSDWGALAKQAIDRIQGGSGAAGQQAPPSEQER
ncbi:MAG TPA: tetratricopeptide repeat protein, partial [Candidatus Krumholzibacterium sp.]|nr:tetratricopeptide repeat protein [Candidatus Krumholzibacterium sp.]